MLDLIYYWAVQANPAVQWAIALAATLGLIANHGGTRRIAIVIGIVTLIFSLWAYVPGWEYQRLIWLTAVNALAAAPLLVHPITARQQVIAATFLGLGAVHFVFAVTSGPVPDPDMLKVNWLVSRLVDAVQAGLLLWWSWPHARERTHGLARQILARLSARRNALASAAPPVRAPD